MTLLTSSRFSFVSLVCAIFLLFSFWALWPSTTTRVDIFPHPHKPEQAPEVATDTDLDSTPLPVDPSLADRPAPVAPSPIAPSPAAPSPGSPSPDPPPSHSGSSAESCRTLPGASDVVIVFKTGASEIYEKLPVHLFTLLDCVPNHLIVSDLTQDIGAFHITDILSSVSEENRKDVAEFEAHKQLKTLFENNEDMSSLKGEQMWNLDKWKFLPMLETTYQEFGNKKWYLFVEADTAVLWSNLLLWLNRLDSNELIYAGSQNSQNGFTFAHGGSGILMSHAAMAKFADAYPANKTRWERDVKEMCCGDVALAKILLELGVKMTPAFPLIQGEAPMTVDWNARHMCTPSVTWHHVNARDINTLWAYQNEWAKGHERDEPFLFHHIFTHYFNDYIQDRRDMWDNISEDLKYTASTKDSEDWAKLSEVQKASINSFEDCRKACIENEECFQFRHRANECVLGTNIRVGRKVVSDSKDEHDRTTSGFLKDRIKAYQQSLEECKAKWEFDQ